jgi:3',5'-cyclic AMP phosphodiesterase CpdA
VNGISFAHLSDLHLPLAARPPRLRDLLSKRFFSWLSWRRSRRHIHRPEALAALMTDVRAAGTDHLVVTGDLTNLSLPDEFARARDWLAAEGSGETVTAVPGNHDALVPVDWAAGQGLWREWMGGAEDEAAFPFVKRVGGVALVGASSATPTGLFLATGRLGQAQSERLRATLEALGREGLFRIVLVHHPITEGAVSGRKALKDRERLRAVLAEAGAELVLHGHAHVATIESVPGPAGPILVAGAPSASAAPGTHGPPAGWRRIDVAALNQGWRLTVSSRTLRADGGIDAHEDLSAEIPRPGTNFPDPATNSPGDA